MIPQILGHVGKTLDLIVSVQCIMSQSADVTIRHMATHVSQGAPELRKLHRVLAKISTHEFRQRINSIVMFFFSGAKTHVLYDSTRKPLKSRSTSMYYSSSNLNF